MTISVSCSVPKRLAQHTTAAAVCARLIAAIHYLRAGRSAFLQDHFDDALKWLNQSVRLADNAGEDQITREARRYLRQMEELTATDPDGAGQNATLLE